MQKATDLLNKVVRAGWSCSLSPTSRVSTVGDWSDFYDATQDHSWLNQSECKKNLSAFITSSVTTRKTTTTQIGLVADCANTFHDLHVTTATITHYRQ